MEVERVPGVGKVWISSREDSGVVGLEAWIAAVVTYWPVETVDRISYPLSLEQATVLRDRLVQLGTTKKPKTAGERYLAAKSKLGLSFKFDYDADGIFLADRASSPDGIDANTAATLSFKSSALSSVECNQLTVEDCSQLAAGLTQILAGHIEPPQDIEA